MEKETNPKNKPSSKKILKEILDFTKIFIIAVFVANLMNIFVFSIAEVRQSSMEDTLIEGDRLVAEKLSYTFGEPKRKDVIVFINPEYEVGNSVWERVIRLYTDIWAKITRTEGKSRYVKRVIGVPGDKIEIYEGFVFVNGEIQEEEYIQEMTEVKSESDYPLIVPEGQYFVLGDNRDSSLDSRDFGCIRREQIEGKVWIRLWPFQKMGTI